MKILGVWKFLNYLKNTFPLYPPTVPCICEVAIATKCWNQHYNPGLLASVPVSLPPPLSISNTGQQFISDLLGQQECLWHHLLTVPPISSLLIKVWSIDQPHHLREHFWKCKISGPSQNLLCSKVSTFFVCPLNSRTVRDSREI